MFVTKIPLASLIPNMSKEDEEFGSGSGKADALEVGSGSGSGSVDAGVDVGSGSGSGSVDAGVDVGPDDVGIVALLNLISLKASGIRIGKEITRPKNIIKEKRTESNAGPYMET